MIKSRYKKLDVFYLDEKHVKRERFHATNELWNRRGFNNPKEIGHTMSLVRSRRWEKKEDWMNWYYSNVISYNKIESVAKQLKKDLAAEGIRYSDLETKEICFFRIIGETWNGFIRETETIKLLELRKPSWIFKLTDAEKDIGLGVDAECFEDGKLVGAVQVKPHSFYRRIKHNAPAYVNFVNKIRKYQDRYPVTVYVIFSKMNGEIISHITYPPNP